MEPSILVEQLGSVLRVVEVSRDDIGALEAKPTPSVSPAILAISRSHVLSTGERLVFTSVLNGQYWRTSTDLKVNSLPSLEHRRPWRRYMAGDHRRCRQRRYPREHYLVSTNVAWSEAKKNSPFTACTDGLVQVSRVSHSLISQVCHSPQSYHTMKSQQWFKLLQNGNLLLE